MRTLTFRSLLLVVLGAAGVPLLGADGPDAASEAKPEAQPVFYFREGSRVTGLPRFEALEVETPYGKLSVPRAQLIQVRFARRLPEELRRKIDQLMEDLGNDDFDRRESAMEALKAIGPPALDAVHRGLHSENEEVRTRSEEIEKEIARAGGEEGPQPEDSLPPLAGSEDEVVTEKMTIKGRILVEKFSVSSRYGELDVGAASLAGIVFRMREAANFKAAVAANHQPTGNWLDTKIELTNGERFRITATGTINVSNYSVFSPPEGIQGYPSTFKGFPSLALVGKVGKNGNEFLVGSNYKGKTSQAGRLYLAVVPFAWNPGGAAGSYQVKVQIAGK